MQTAATMSSATPVYQMAQNTYLKLENLNLGGSHKTRSARWMIESAVKSKVLNGNTNQVIIEKTGGNLGIGLAIEANRRGIPLELAVGLSFSAHKRALLWHYGATLIGKEMMNDGAQPREVIEWHLANQEQLGKDYVFLDQFKNEANLHAHLFETGPEIADHIVAQGLDDKHIYLVCGVGSGASLSGIGLALKQRFEEVTICAVQPAGCDMDKGIFVNHGLEGLAVGVKPPIYRSDIVDFYIDCSEEAALAERKWLLRKHGIFSGKSSGANLHGIRVLTDRLKDRGELDTSVVISLIYDSGDSYI